MDSEKAAPLTGCTDAHFHVWQRDASTYAWLDHAPEELQDSVTDEEALTAIAALGAERVILVQADDSAGDTSRMQTLAERWEMTEDGPLQVDVVAWLPLTRPHAVASLLEDGDSMRHVVGVRHLIHSDPDAGFLDRDDVGRSLSLLSEAGLPLDIPDAFPRHMEQVAALARRHPDLTLVLDHLGKPPFGDHEAMEAWRSAIEDLATLPSVVAKLSGLGSSGTGEFRQDPVIGDAVALALDLFGPERLMYGSDWPMARMPRTTDDALELADHIRTRHAEHAQQILDGTARRVYRRISSPVSSR